MDIHLQLKNGNVGIRPLLTFSQSVVQELQIRIVLLLTTYHITCMNILKTVLIIIQRSKY
jgi:hypothetical protein